MKKNLLTFFFGVACSLFCMQSFAQERSVTGMVTDAATGEPLIGVNIVVEGTTIGTISDADGSYSITVPSAESVIDYSFVGYTTQQIRVGNQTEINVELEPSAVGLDELVVIGYGTQRRGSITGAISSVDSDDIQERPVLNAGEALQGRAPGVVALSDGGSTPGTDVTIRIRGRRSLTATNEPLFVVDGIPWQGSITGLNPKDIKSMEVLKDASATAIYGSRGANGVILITTYRGGNMPTTVSYSGHYGVSSVLAVPDLMNGEEYYRLKEVGGRAFTQAELDAYQAGVSTDWVDLVLDNGYQTNNQLSVRGGNEQTAYAMSANFFKEQGVIELQDYTRKTFRLNLDHQATDWLKVGTSTQVVDGLRNVGPNTYGGAVNISPLAEPYDDEGNLIYRPGADPLLWNPLADYEEDVVLDERQTYRVFSNIFAEVDILKNLGYRMNFGPSLTTYRRGLFQGSMSGARQGGNPLVRKEHNKVYQYTFENILTYNLDTEDHNLNFTGLYSIQESYAENTFIEVEDIPYESQLYHNLGTAETVNNLGSDLSEWGIMSFMGRVNYELMDKYMVTLTGRWDGSSRLAEGNKWGFFPSAALMWRISNEGFMTGQDLVNDLRLRASYGVTGNTGIDPYQTRGALTRTYYNFGDNSGLGFRPYALANPELRWESSATANLGLDFGLMQGRITGSFEVYNTNTTDLLLQRQLPITSGFNSVFENIGETRNRGWELGLTTRNIATGDFSWETNLILFGNKEEIVDLYGTGEDDVGNEWFIGEPLTVWYDYEKIGIWQLGEEDAASVYAQVPGEIKIKDQDENNIINQDDRVILGSDMPRLTVSLGSRLEYKGVDFSFMLLGVFGHTVYNNYLIARSTLQGRYNNLDVDYWTESNPTNEHPKPDGSREYPLYSSTRGYYPGDFFKIKNVQLGYNVPRTPLVNIGVKKLRVYLNLDTFFIWSHLQDGLDPEKYGGYISAEVPSCKCMVARP
ncbi:MAG: TonB-dependent receptor [Bacteroidales bacterium]